jgi:hypothetical protein
VRLHIRAEEGAPGSGNVDRADRVLVRTDTLEIEIIDGDDGELQVRAIGPQQKLAIVPLASNGVRLRALKY